MADIKYFDEYNQVHRYLCGDEEVGRTLYANVYSFTKASIYNMTKSSILNDADRDDILHDTFMTSIEKLYTYNGTSKFSTFIYGIAKNKIQEKLRSKRKEIDIDIEEYSDTISLFSKDPLSIIIEKEKKAAIISAMNSLSDDHMQVVQLRFNGMSSKQIASITRKSEEAIDSMYYRALKALKSNFKKIYN